MHIADGILPVPVLCAGAASALALTAVGLRGLADEDLPRAALAAALFFTGSLIRIPLGPLGSAHLLLLGLAGVVLGRRAPLAVAVGATLQCLVFQHGGLTALGVNVTTMGTGALVAGLVAGRGLAAAPPARAARRAGLAGAAGAAAALALYAAALLTAGEALATIARVAVLAHLPVVLAEGAIAAATARFLVRVEPGLLAGGAGGGAGAS